MVPPAAVTVTSLAPAVPVGVVQVMVVAMVEVMLVHGLPPMVTVMGVSGVE